jgi:hypothetical protein
MFLEEVEAGILKINPTKSGIQATQNVFNHEVWQRSAWSPVTIP